MCRAALPTTTCRCVNALAAPVDTSRGRVRETGVAVCDMQLHPTHSLFHTTPIRTHRHMAPSPTPRGGAPRQQKQKPKTKNQKPKTKAGEGAKVGATAPPPFRALPATASGGADAAAECFTAPRLRTAEAQTADAKPARAHDVRGRRRKTRTQRVWQECEGRLAGGAGRGAAHLCPLSALLWVTVRLTGRLIPRRRTIRHNGRWRRCG